MTVGRLLPQASEAPRPLTGKQRVLAALADGRWHDHHELYDLRVIVHSRVSDLRRDGHVIEHRRDGDLYLYRLVGSLDAATPQADGDTTSVRTGGGVAASSVPSDPRGAPGRTSPGDLDTPDLHPGQLTIGQAA